MQLYNATVKIKSPDSVAVTHELPKEDLSAPEILVLKRIHGDEGVVNISPTKMDKRSHKEELDRLMLNYSPKQVFDTFGPVPLSTMPVKLEGFGLADEVRAEKAEQEKPVKK